MFVKNIGDFGGLSHRDGEKLGGARRRAADHARGGEPVAHSDKNTVHARGIQRAQAIAEIIRVLDAVEQDVKAVPLDRQSLDGRNGPLRAKGDDAAV